MIIYNKLYSVHNQIVKNKPLILSLTNSVTQDFIANTLLALGCAPIMSESEAELSELISIAQSININIGTLNHNFDKRALTAAKLAKQNNKCIILDPVGAGATKDRTKLATQLAPYAAIIRGNASEILAICGKNKSITAGVESIHQSEDSIAEAAELAQKYKNVIVISGRIDQVIGGQNTFSNSFGDPLMTKVTGMGCTLSAVIAAFAATETNYALASYLALIYYTLCAEQVIIKKAITTPAKFKTEFIDCIYQPDWSFIQDKLHYIDYRELTINDL